MLIVDVDDLKLINDSKGHPQGDRAICLIADAMRAQFRKTDVIGRIGGDEFVVFLEGVESREKLEDMASGLLARLSGVRIGERDDVPVRVSIGIADTRAGQEAFDALYARADKALYLAKKNGKNRLAFAAERA